MKDIKKLMFLFEADKDIGGSTDNTDRGNDTNDTSDRDTSVNRTEHRDTDRSGADTERDTSRTETSESTTEAETSKDDTSDEGNAYEAIELTPAGSQVDTEEKKTARQTVEDVMKGAKDLSTQKWAQTEKQKEEWGADLSRTQLYSEDHKLSNSGIEQGKNITPEEAEALVAEREEKAAEFKKLVTDVTDMVENIREVSPDEIRNITNEFDVKMKDLQTELEDIQNKLDADPNNKQLQQAKESIVKNYGEAAIQAANAIEKLEQQLGVNPTRETATWGELYDYYMQEGTQSGFWTAVGAFAKSAWETIKQGINPFDRQSQFDRALKQAKALRAQAETVVRVADVAQKTGFSALNLDSMLRTKVPFNSEDGLNIAYMTNADPSFMEMIKAGVAANVNRSWMKNYFTTEYKGNLAKIGAIEKYLAADDEAYEAANKAKMAGWDGGFTPEALNMPEVRNYMQKASIAKQAEKESQQVCRQAMDDLIEAMNKGAKMRRTTNFASSLSEMGVGLATMMVNVPLGLSIAAKGLFALGDEATANSLLRAKMEFEYHEKRTLAAMGAYGTPKGAPENDTSDPAVIIPEEEELDFETINGLKRRSQDAQNSGANRGLSDNDIYSFIKQNYAKDGALQKLKV